MDLFHHAETWHAELIQSFASCDTSMEPVAFLNILTLRILVKITQKSLNFMGRMTQREKTSPSAPAPAGLSLRSPIT